MILGLNNASYGLNEIVKDQNTPKIIVVRVIKGLD